MKKQLQKKISACRQACMAFIVIAMMFSVSAKAQIVYTDVNPDITVNTDSGVYHLDLNNDGITDFDITYNSPVVASHCGGYPITGTNFYIKITPLGANEVGNDPSLPNDLNYNSPIDSIYFTWRNTANQILARKIWGCSPGGPPGGVWQSYSAGNWIGATNRHIALRLDVNSQKYYGWVRLTVATGTTWSFTVQAYAYNLIPNQLILAGQTTIATGLIENSFVSSINLYPNPAQNHLTIELPNTNKKVKITISDIKGNIIYTTTAGDSDSSDSYRDQQIEVDTKDFAEGVYLVQVQSAKYLQTKKLIVTR